MLEQTERNTDKLVCLISEAQPNIASFSVAKLLSFSVKIVINKLRRFYFLGTKYFSFPPIFLPFHTSCNTLIVCMFDS